MKVFHNGFSVELVGDNVVITTRRGRMIVLDDMGNVVNNDSRCSCLKVGDFIRYNPSIPEVEIGYESSGVEKIQKYRPIESTLWRVLWCDDGVVEIVSAESIGTVELYGSVGFCKAVETFNTLSSAFVNPKYATSGRCLGATDESLGCIDESLICADYSRTWGDPRGDNEVGYKDMCFKRDFNQIKKHKIELPNDVFLASRNIVHPQRMRAGGRMYIRKLGKQGALAMADLWFNLLYWREETAVKREFHAKAGFLPVITLRDDVNFTEGDGSFESPWKLEI